MNIDWQILMKNSTIYSVYDDLQNCSFTNAILRYFGTLIFTIGMISTILSICVFARKPLRKSTEYPSFKKNIIFICIQVGNPAVSIS